MLEDAADIRRVVIACETVDIRKGIGGLAMITGDRYDKEGNIDLTRLDYLLPWSKELPDKCRKPCR